MGRVNNDTGSANFFSGGITGGGNGPLAAETTDGASPANLGGGGKARCETRVPGGGNGGGNGTEARRAIGTPAGSFAGAASERFGVAGLSGKLDSPK